MFKDERWWGYLGKEEQSLLEESFLLLEWIKELEGKKVVDYSFVVCPAAKAYEGFLKKLFFDLGLISNKSYRSDRFRIGRALNPALEKRYGRTCLYDELKEKCGSEEVPKKLWETWKRCRNRLFHFFPDDLHLIDLGEAEKRLNEVVEGIKLACSCCSK